MEICKCDSGIGNTGLPQGVKPFGALSYIIAVPTYDSEGNLNVIDCSVPLDQAFLDSKLNEDDPTKRWYPIKDLKNIVRDKGDPVTREFDDGSSEFVRFGSRGFTAEIPNATATFLGKLVGGRCQELSFYEVDVCLNFGGNDATEGYSTPYKISNSTLNAFLMLAQAGTQNQSISLNFQYDITEKDENRSYISAGSIDANLLPRSVNGLLDVEAIFSNTLADSTDVLLTYEYGGACDKLPYTTALQTDFTLFNETTGLAVPLTGFTMVNALSGSYNIQFAAQTASDIMVLSILPSNKNGFEMVGSDFTAV